LLLRAKHLFVAAILAGPQRATPFLTSCFTADRSACAALDAALAAFAGVMEEEG
jgi:hypothetical protein